MANTTAAAVLTALFCGAVAGFLIGPGGGQFGCADATVSVPGGVVSGDTYFLCNVDAEPAFRRPVPPSPEGSGSGKVLGWDNEMDVGFKTQIPAKGVAGIDHADAQARIVLGDNLPDGIGGDFEHGIEQAAVVVESLAEFLGDPVPYSAAQSSRCRLYVTVRMHWVVMHILTQCVQHWAASVYWAALGDARMDTGDSGARYAPDDALSLWSTSQYNELVQCDDFSK